MGKSSWEVALNSHHLTMDGWSLSTVMADVLKLYHGEALTTPLPFRDYAAWLQTRPTETSLAWWRETLSGFDKPEPASTWPSSTKRKLRRGNTFIQQRGFIRTRSAGKGTPNHPEHPASGSLGGTGSPPQRRRRCRFRQCRIRPSGAASRRRNMVGNVHHTVPVRIKTADRTLRAIVEN